MTSKEFKFCCHYISTGNTKEAAMLSGYKNDPEQKGTELLAREEISNEIEHLYEEKKKHLIYKACVGYERLAFGNIADAVKLLFIENLDEQTLNEMDLFNIAEIKKPKDGAMEIKFFDRLKALEKLEQSDGNQRTDINPFYYALEQGIKSLGSKDTGNLEGE